MLNLARNGRVPMAVAKIAGMLGIRVVGIALDDSKESGCLGSCLLDILGFCQL